MRKLLLLFTFLIASVAFAQAQTVGTVTFSNNGYDNAQAVASFKVDDINFELVKSSASTAATYYNTGTGIRCYPNSQIKISAPVGTTIQKMVMTSASGYAFGANTSVTTGTISTSGQTTTWTGDASEISITVQSDRSSSKHVRWQKIEVTYTKGNGPNVTPPTITMAENNMVVLAQEDGGDIYYTTDGTTAPTNASTKYTAPFAITAKTTVKAIAYVNGEASPVTTKTVSPNTVGNIAEFIALAPTEATKINAPVTAIYQNGKNLYIKDSNDNFILVFGNISGVTGVQNGDEFSFITGTYSPYRGLPELIPSAIGEKTSGTEAEPYEVNLTDIDGTMLNQYVVLSDITITYTGSDNKSYTMTDADGNTLAIYNNFFTGNTTGYTAVEIPEGEGFTVYGFVSTNNGTPQIQPILVEGGKVMETVATPVIEPNGGAISIGDKITITCATEGASIYYTTEDEISDATLMPYTGEITFSEAMAIKAIAKKEGMLDSDVVTATFTVYDPNKTEATFNFTDITTLTPAFNADEAKADGATGNKYIEIDGTALTCDNVMFVAERDGTGTTPRLYIRTNDQQLRIYKGSSMTISVPEQFEITSIQIAYMNTAYIPLADGEQGSVSTETSTKTSTWTPGEGESVHSVKFSIPSSGSNSQVNTITVSYKATGLGAIDDIFGDADTDAPVEYYNIQGVRIAAENLTPGFYIVRQGNKTAKVLIRK